MLQPPLTLSPPQPQAVVPCGLFSEVSAATSGCIARAGSWQPGPSRHTLAGSARPSEVDSVADRQASYSIFFLTIRLRTE